MRLALVVSLVIAILGSPAVAQTEQSPPLDLDSTAAAHFGLAVTAYRAGQWEAARAEFQACYDLSQRPDLLHNLSLVAEKQGRWADSFLLERDFQAHAQLTEAERQESAARCLRIQLRLQPPAPAPTTTPPRSSAPPRRTHRSLAIGGFVLAGTFLAVALGTGVAGTLRKQDLESRPISLTELADGQNAATVYQGVTIGFSVLGAGLFVGSITLVATEPKQP